MRRSFVPTLIVVILAILPTACSDNPASDPESALSSSRDEMRKPLPPGNANPAIAFNSGYQLSGNRSVRAIYVIDADGGNRTMVYANYTNRTTNDADFPTWSADGSKLCVTLNDKDLYRMNIGLVNGYPVTSNAVKIADGVADGGKYRKGVWNPAPNALEIAVVWRPTSGIQSLRMVPFSGNPMTTLYTSPSTDYVINDDIAFSPDGSKLAFTEFQQSTGYNYLKIISRSTGTIVQMINLSQYYRITGLTWGKSSGSSTLAFTVIPTPCGKEYNNLYTIDIAVPTPTPVLYLSGYGSQDVSFAPGDQSFAFVSVVSSYSTSTGCWSQSLSGMAVYVWNPLSYTLHWGYNPDWKR